MIYQLNPTIKVVTPLGKGDALIFIDYGMCLDKYWVVNLPGKGLIHHFIMDEVMICTDSAISLNDSNIFNFREN